MGTDVKQRIEAAFAQHPSILDGGLGAEFLRHDIDLERDLLGHERCFELLSITRPELVREVHESFREAGARWLTTNTFCADPGSLKLHGLQSRGSELTRAAVELCRAAARDETVVLGSVGPGRSLPDAHETRAFIEDLVDAGVDGLLLETQVDGATLDLLMEQALAVRDQQGRGLFIAVSLVADLRGALPVCKVRSQPELFAKLRDSGVDLLALNCSTGFEPLRPALTRLRPEWTGRLGVYPNAGIPTLRPDGSWHYPIGPDEFAHGVLALQHEFDLDLIGGCCGTTPAHIRALRL